ncbi:MAG: hypothetical protein ABII74_10040 [Elusimicrobiota bacterium]
MRYILLLSLILQTTGLPAVSCDNYQQYNRQIERPIMEPLKAISGRYDKNDGQTVRLTTPMAKQRSQRQAGINICLMRSCPRSRQTKNFTRCHPSLQSRQKHHPNRSRRQNNAERSNRRSKTGESRNKSFG